MPSMNGPFAVAARLTPALCRQEHPGYGLLEGVESKQAVGNRYPDGPKGPPIGGRVTETLPFRSRLLSDDVKRRIVYYPRTLAAALYVREHIGKPIRLEAVATLTGLTPCAFSRYFTEKVGITFSTLVKTLRIEQAVDQLETQSGAISALATLTGYQSCCTFSRAFKDVMGQSPTEYRRRLLHG